MKPTARIRLIHRRPRADSFSAEVGDTGSMQAIRYGSLLAVLESRTDDGPNAGPTSPTSSPTATLHLHVLPAWCMVPCTASAAKYSIPAAVSLFFSHAHTPSPPPLLPPQPGPQLNLDQGAQRRLRTHSPPTSDPCRPNGESPKVERLGEAARQKRLLLTGLMTPNSTRALCPPVNANCEPCP